MAALTFLCIRLLMVLRQPLCIFLHLCLHTHVHDIVLNIFVAPSLKNHLTLCLKVTKPLLETSRSGYLAAISASSYSFVSLLKHFLPIMNPGNAHPFSTMLALIQLLSILYFSLAKSTTVLFNLRPFHALFLSQIWIYPLA